MDRVRETQLQVGENSNWILRRLKAFNPCHGELLVSTSLFEAETADTFYSYTNHEPCFYLRKIHTSEMVLVWNLFINTMNVYGSHNKTLKGLIKQTGEIVVQAIQTH